MTAGPKIRHIHVEPTDIKQVDRARRQFDKKTVACNSIEPAFVQENIAQHYFTPGRVDPPLGCIADTDPRKGRADVSLPVEVRPQTVIDKVRVGNFDS